MADTVRSWLNEFGDASLIPLRWRLLLDMSLSQTAAIHCVLLLWLLSEGVASYRSLFRERSLPKGYSILAKLSPLRPPGRPSVRRPSVIPSGQRTVATKFEQYALAGVLFRSEPVSQKSTGCKGHLASKPGEFSCI